jgi:hypothetical protein
MNRARTREVVDKLMIPVVKSDGHGIEIHREVTARRFGISVSATETERWRLYTGGGIAGNSDHVWLSPIMRVYAHDARGPFWNKTQLEKALRAWRRGL